MREVSQARVNAALSSESGRRSSFNKESSEEDEVSDDHAAFTEDWRLALTDPIYATMTQRFFAYLLDFVPVILLCVLYYFCLPKAILPDQIVGLVAVMLYRFSFHTLFGSTVGKYILAIEVVQEAGSTNPRPIAMLVRETIGFVVSGVFGIGYWLPTNRKHKAWSDTMAGTIVQHREARKSRRIIVAIGLVIFALIEGFAVSFQMSRA